MTSCGLNGGPFVAKGTYPSPICCNLTNGKVPHCACPGARLPHISFKGEEHFISEIENNTMIGYKYFDFNDVKSIKIKYRTYDIVPKGEMIVKLSPNGDAIGRISVSDNKNWTEAGCNISVPNGVYPLYFFYEGDGSIEFLEFTFE